MARDITSGFEAEIEADTLKPVLLLKAQFDSGTVYMWTGYGDLVFNSETYSGVGHFLAIDGVEETQELRAASTKFKLAGIPSGLLSLALSENYQGRNIFCYFGVLDTAGALIADPYLVFKGKMDVMEITDNGETAEITVSAENDLIDLRTVRERKYTPEDQRAYYPTDKGLDFVPTIQDVQITWGVGVTQ
jgi:hypothetical protein